MTFEIHIVAELLEIGLKLLKWEDHQLARVCSETQVSRHRARFGANPGMHARMSEDPEKTTLKDAKVHPFRRCINQCHVALCFLWSQRLMLW